MSRILVTGATGFAGSHLVARLPEAAAIVAWAGPSGRRGHTISNPATRAIEWRSVDLLDRRAVTEAIADAQPDVVYHLAGAPHVGTSFDTPTLPLEINALGTHHLLRAIEHAAREARVVVVTSAMIYGASSDPHAETSRLAPGSPYGLSKLAQDRLATLAAADGLRTIVARPFNHTGARQDPSFAMPGFAEQIARIEKGLDEPVLRVGNLDAQRDISDVRDIVDGYATIAARGEAGAAYNVCSGTAYRIGDLLDRLLSRAHVSVRVDRDPARVRPIELPRLVGDNSRLRALGWSPRITVDEMLADVLDYWRSTLA